MFGLLNAWRQRSSNPVIIDAGQWQSAEAGLPFLAHLPDAERQALRQLATEFITSKEWSAAPDFTLTAAMQVDIALQASLLVLKLGLDWYKGFVGVVVYPGDFIVPRRTLDEAGVVHEYEEEVLGEAWEGGPVLVSWIPPAERWEGVNVVIHEFAHKLDMTNGDTDGMPALHGAMTRDAWAAAFGPAYEDFCHRVDGGEDTTLDPYAAESPAEFFAVMSEAFFQTPALLQADYPAVYGQLARFYRQDPCAAC